MTATVKFVVPTVVGEPVIRPDVLMVNPDGKEPEVTAKVYGEVPPMAVNWNE